MYRSLSKHANVVPLGRPYAPTRFRELVQKFQTRALRRNQNPESADALRSFGRFVEKQLQSTPVDIVFAPINPVQPTLERLDSKKTIVE